MRLLSLAAFVMTMHLPAERLELTILHTNDIHGHIHAWSGWDGDLLGKTIGGFDRLASVAARIRKETANVLLLDAGDAIGDTQIASSTRGAAVIDLMNRVGYDAMVIGNHEPDYGMQTLQQRIQEARFAVLAANVVESSSGRLFTKPYSIREVGGLKIGILGLAYPNTPKTTAQKNVAGFEFRQATETAQKYLPELRSAGAGMVVVLSHLGLSADRRLAEQIDGIDVIVGGHSHNRMTQPMRAGNTLIVQAGAHLSDVGRLNLTIDGDRIVSSSAQLIPLDHSVIPADSALTQHMQRYAEDRQSIATAGAPLIRAQTLAGGEPRKRDEESPVDSLFADLVRERTGADIAFLPGVGYGVALLSGAISVAALRNLIPHESKIVRMRLKGRQVREILEQSVENVLTDDPKVKVGGMIQVSGLTFRYDPRRRFGERILEVSVGGKALTPDTAYTVATNSMLADGGHNYTTFTAGVERRQHEQQFEIVEQSLRAKKTVLPPAPGRITNEATRIP